MKTIFRNAIFLALGIVYFSCTEKESVVYGPEFKINGMEAEIMNIEYYSDSIPADEFKVVLHLLSENNYAVDYGLEPQLISKIKDLKVILNNHEEVERITDENVTEYFLVEDGYNDSGLYETIEQYCNKESIKILNPRLVFTNQVSIEPGAEELITDSVVVDLTFSLTLEDQTIFSENLNALLIPNRTNNEKQNY